MKSLGFPLLVQLCLTFGMAGLLWPDKFKEFCERLMFPVVIPSYRAVRASSVGAIVLSVLLFFVLVVQIQ